jgi:hypothetical protein
MQTMLKNVDAKLVAAHLRNLGATYLKKVHRSPLDGYDIVENEAEVTPGKRVQIVCGDPSDHAALLAKPADFLLFSNDADEVEGLLGAKTNAIVMPAQVELEKTCAELDELFRSTRSFPGIAQRMVETLQGTNLLRDYLNIAADELENPCAVFDSTSRCIESSSNPLSGGAVWNAATTNELSGVSEHDRKWLIEGFPALASAYPYPEIVCGGPGEGRAAIMGLDARQSGQFIFAVQEYDTALGRDKLPLMWYIGNFLTYYLHSHQRRSYGDSIHIVLEDIAYGTERDPHRIARRIGNTGYEIEAGSRVVAFRNFLTVLSRSQLDVVRDEVSTRLGTPTIVSGDEVITLVGRGKDDAIRQLVSPKGRLSWRRDICCGVSYPFDSGAQLLKAFTQAEEALTWGDRFEPARRVHEFRRIVFCSMVNNLKEGYNPYDFCDPRALSILEYDKHNGTHLAITLYAYLKEFEQTIKVAAFLGIHPNSVLYRLKKARELFGLDFDDSFDLYMIELTFDILVSIPDNEEDRRLLLPSSPATSS